MSMIVLKFELFQVPRLQSLKNIRLRSTPRLSCFPPLISSNWNCATLEALRPRKTLLFLSLELNVPIGLTLPISRGRLNILETRLDKFRLVSWDSKSGFERLDRGHSNLLNGTEDRRT